VGGGGGKGGEMTQTLYAYMNKIKIKKKSAQSYFQAVYSKVYHEYSVPP
jgi:hypothetical protein